MSDPFRKVQSGDRLRIPAAAYNAILDTVRERRDRSVNLGRELIRSSSALVRVKNATGADVARFGVLGVGAALFPATSETFKNAFDILGQTPDMTAHLGRFVITAEPIAAGQVGRAYSSGVCPAQLNVIDQADRFADVESGVTATLKTGTSGAAAILWKDPGGGLQGTWAIVKLGLFTIHHGPFAGVITAVDTGSKTYNARASHDPSITVTGQAPMLRPFNPGTIALNMAMLGDPCTLMVLEDRTVVLWAVPETWGTEPACELT